MKPTLRQVRCHQQATSCTLIHISYVFKVANITLTRRLRFVFVIAVISLSMLVIVMSLPYTLEKITESKLEGLGATEVSVELAELGLVTSRVQGIQLVYEQDGRRFTISSGSINLSYELSELIFGKLDTISVQDVLVRIEVIAGRDDVKQANSDDIDMPNPADWLALVPFSQLSLQRLHIEIPSTDGGTRKLVIHGDITANGDSLQGNVVVATEGYGTQQVVLSLAPAAESRLTLSDVGNPVRAYEYVTFKTDTWAFTDQHLLTDTVIDIDLQALQQVFKSWGISVIPDKTTGKFRAEGALKLPLQPDSKTANEKPLWLAKADLNMRVAELAGIGKDIDLLMPLELAIYRDLVQWTVSKRARMTMYPEIEGHTEGIVKDIIKQQGKQKLAISFPQGARGEFGFVEGNIAEASIPLREPVQVVYGTDSTPLVIDVRMTSLDIDLHSPLALQVDTQYSMQLSKVRALPAETLQVRGRAHIELADDIMQVTMQPRTTMSLQGVKHDETVIKSVTANLISRVDCDYRIETKHLACQPFSLDMVIPALRHKTNSLTTSPFRVKVNALSGEKDHWQTAFDADIPAWSVSLGKAETAKKVKLDRVAAVVNASNDAVSAKLSISAAEDAVNGHVDIAHSLRTQQGNARYRLEPVNMQLNGNTFTQVYEGMPHKLLLNAGTIEAEGEINWTKSKQKPDQPVVRQQGTLELTNLGGAWDEIAFSGLDSHFSVSGIDKLTVSTKPVLTMAKLEPGVLVSEITLQAKMFLQASAAPVITVSGLELTMLGGKVTGDLIELDLNREQNPFTLQLSGLDVEELLKLEQKQGLYGTGIVDGELPLLLTRNGITMQDGRIGAREPGGKLRYSADERVKGMAASNKGVELLLKAMEDFNYQVLKADVNYTPDGLLKMKVQLKGFNPELEGGRPVHLNVDVEDNILTLLRSIRLADEISEKIGEQVQQRKKAK